jgi:SAM-dependent methyltransferase
VRVLSRHFAELLPPGAKVLDVGCGDGRIGTIVQSLRPDVEVTGLDIAVRHDAQIPVQEFDGRTIPIEDNAVDVVMLVDVLHHADDPIGLLSEVVRVADRAVLLKDVTPLGPGSNATLMFMDWVGNSRHGVPLPYKFWTQEEWREAFASLGLAVDASRRRLGLYSLPWSLLFEKRMHFILRLVPQRGQSRTRPA